MASECRRQNFLAEEEYSSVIKDHVLVNEEHTGLLAIHSLSLI